MLRCLGYVAELVWSDNRGVCTRLNGQAFRVSTQVVPRYGGLILDENSQPVYPYQFETSHSRSTTCEPIQS